MRLAALSVLALALGTTPAPALDEDVMRNILSPILLAQNLTAVCAKLDPDFTRETGGRDGDAGAVIAHMKDHVLGAMTREEAAPIVASAAGAARAVGLGMIRPLSGGTVEEQAGRIRSLCLETARPLVRGLVENHDARHDFFDQMLRDARRD